MKKSVLVAMSGGVDSSVSLLLLKQQGYDCIGAMMNLYDSDNSQAEESQTDGVCGSLRDVDDARKVANSLGVPFHVYDFTDNFRKNIIQQFVDSYVSGATPNPCIECNRYMKFGNLFNCTKECDAEFFATGHYARIEQDSKTGRYLLKKALDETKDQSYYLYSLSQEQLSRSLFPLGELRKSEVREIAAKNGFDNANKSDSQDICFVRDGDYAGFIERFSNASFEPGNFIDTHGNILGKHKGLIRYTVGQRKGLGISLNKPMYVLSKNTVENTVTLCGDNELFSTSLDAKHFNLIAYDKLDSPIRVAAKIRYAHIPQSALATPTSENTLRLEFDEPQRAITKGQAVVLYDDDVVIGGGTIC